MYNNTLDKISATKYNPPRISAVHYCKAEQSYISTNGHVLIQEYTTDEYPADRYFVQTQDITENYQASHDYPNWKALFTTPTTCPAEFTQATLYTRTGKNRNLTKNIIQTATGEVFNADYIKHIYAVLGAGGEWSHNTDKRIYYYATDKGRACVCPIVGKYEEQYTQVRTLTLDEYSPAKSKSAKAPKVAWVILDEHGIPKAVATNQKSLNEFCHSGFAPAECIAVPVL